MSENKIHLEKNEEIVLRTDHFREFCLRYTLWRLGGLMASALVSLSSGPGSSPGWGLWVVFLSKTSSSRSGFLHPGV